VRRIAVCGGPYANPYALAAFAADARARGAERLYCLGDLGGFGAEVDALWPILTENEIVCIAGNYDVAIARADADCGCGYRDPTDQAYAQLIYDHTLATTSRAFAAWMGRLPTQRREHLDGVDLHLVHGSPLALNDFWWESLPDAEHRLRTAASGAEVICCTHTGLPWAKRIAGSLVVNVGVLGKPPNDGRPQARYALVDLDHGAPAAEIVALDYDWAAQAASMRAAGLPEAFAETIETGWWTTCIESLPPAERSAGRYHLYRSALPRTFAPTGGAWTDTTAQVNVGPEERPVVPLFASPWFPPRLWIYTNFHCNLACDYCAVASSPRATPRKLTAARVRALVDEALAEGFQEIYFTGGEPFLHPEIAEMLAYSATRLPTVVLTNAMLFRGRRLQQLGTLAGQENLVIQTSLDGATPATHDAHRGRGSFARTIDGIRTLVDLDLTVRVALTETEQNTHEIPAVADLLDRLGVRAERLAVRPLLRRGLSDGGADLETDATVPELTVTAEGLAWHPAGADRATSPDMHLAGPGTPLAEAKRLVTERFLTARQADGSLPRPYRCAV
jgi:pyruvate-formate lyase-activating enzyme/predicted phosphodiesterase